MSPVDEIENHIRTSRQLIGDYETILQTAGDPKEKLRCKREIEAQWTLIEGYLEEYYPVCRDLNRPMPDDIREIAAHFPRFLAQDFQRVYSTLRRVTPAGVDALDQLVKILRELGRFHEHLNEWKELHNLLQECTTSLLPLKGELESAIDHPESWRKTSGLRLWGACRTQLQRLESFAREIKHIDDSFRREGGAIRGPDWMIAIAILRDDLEPCLKEGDPETIYSLTADLWDTCFDALYLADKRLRDKAGELYGFSSAILRSVENDSHNG